MQFMYIEKGEIRSRTKENQNKNIKKDQVKKKRKYTQALYSDYIYIENVTK